jgi:hypothetical protein
VGCIEKSLTELLWDVKRRLPSRVMMEPHPEHSGVPEVTGTKGSSRRGPPLIRRQVLVRFSSMAIGFVVDLTSEIRV